MPNSKNILTTEYADSISAISPTSMSQVIVHNPAVNGEYTICLLKVVSPEEEQTVSRLHTMITSTAHNPWALPYQQCNFYRSGFGQIFFSSRKVIRLLFFTLEDAAIDIIKYPLKKE